MMSLTVVGGKSSHSRSITADMTLPDTRGKYGLQQSYVSLSVHGGQDE